MKTVPISLIKVEERQRKQIDEKALQELKTSIYSKGLFHAPVLSYSEPNNYSLLVGERRLRAMEQLHTEGLTFHHDLLPVPLGEIPYVLISDLTPAQLLEAELEENLLRVNLTWQELTEARAKIHLARQMQNPDQTLKATAAEIAERTGASQEYTRKELSKALIIDKHKADPVVKTAKSAEDAYRAILDKYDTEFKAIAAKQATTTSTTHQLTHGDCRKLILDVPDGSINTILCDPPYGMNADKMRFDEDHHYNDSPDYAMEICQTILREGFRVAKPRASLFMFCDVVHFELLKEYASQQAWTVWRTPLIWYKGIEGHAPWGRGGFKRTYEMILFAVKGQKDLVSSGGPDVLEFKRQLRSEKTHAAGKPIDLLHKLVSLSCNFGDTILDPCCGSGGIFHAAHQHKCTVIGFEQEEAYYHQSLAAIGELAGIKVKTPASGELDDLLA